MNIIINISGVYEEEGWTIPGALRVDLPGLPSSNCYCDTEAEGVLRGEISKLPLNSAHWIDTGDYHYISKLWMEKINEPFVLALFDNHPDDQQGSVGDILSCGSWVRSARETLPFMRADYLNKSGIPDGLPVYLSIDLDVMPRQYARTDWNQGQMSLDELLSSISRIAEGHRILGADICGGITAAKGARAEDYATNIRTRQILADYFSCQITFSDSQSFKAR